MLIPLAMLGAGLALLYAGGSWLVTGASSVAIRAGMSPLIVGMTVVAFATSSPELVVSLDSAMRGVDDVAVGNVVGSNIANVGLVLGIAALVHPIRVQARMLRNDMPWLLLATVFVVWRLGDESVGRLDGLLLFAGLVLFLFYNARIVRRERQSVQEEFGKAVPAKAIGATQSWALTALGVAALAGGGAVCVAGATRLAEIAGVSTGLVGLTLVALGTSLPELATSIVASLRGKGDIATGNVVGSNFFNLLCVLGLTGLIHPLGQGDIRPIDLYVMLGFTGLLLPIMHSGIRIGRREGVLLLLCYAAYIWVLSDRLPPS